jgi:hypothetical protein
MDVSSQAVQTLMEIGVASAGNGLIPPAIAIFEGVRAVRPDSEGPALGMAIAQLGSRAYEDAAKTLREQVLAKNPNSIEAKMFLGLALKYAGRNAECDSVIKELIASSDERARTFATTLKAP